MQAVHLLSRLSGGEAGGQPFDLQIGLAADAWVAVAMAADRDSGA